MATNSNSSTEPTSTSAIRQEKSISGPINPIASLASISNTSPNPNEAASKLVEAIDEFLGDIEKKFKGISEEILGKLDEMAERCDKLEQDMLTRETDRIRNEAGSVMGESTS